MNAKGIVIAVLGLALFVGQPSMPFAYSAENPIQGKERSLNEYLKQLKSDKADVRFKAAKELWVKFNMLALQPKEKSAVVAALSEALKDQNVMVRSEVVYALQMYCSVVRGEAKAAVLALIEALLDDDLGVREAAIGALGAIGPRAKIAIPSLVLALKDPDFINRKKTVWALGAIGSDGKLVVPALVEVLENDEAPMRMEAAYALATIGREAEASLPALKKAAEGKSFDVRLAARLAMWRISGDDKQFRQALDDGAMQKDPAVALTNALGLLLNVGPAAVGVIVDNLKHPSAGVREILVTTLQLIQPPPKQAVPALIQALQDASPNVRQAAADALLAIDPEAAKKAGVK